MSSSRNDGMDVNAAATRKPEIIGRVARVSSVLTATR